MFIVSKIVWADLLYLIRVGPFINAKSVWARLSNLCGQVYYKQIHVGTFTDSKFIWVRLPSVNLYGQVCYC